MQNFSMSIDFALNIIAFLHVLPQILSISVNFRRKLNRDVWHEKERKKNKDEERIIIIIGKKTWITEIKCYRAQTPNV